jgi:sugar/nucleoside kinase (ribokinase family)
VAVVGAPFLDLTFEALPQLPRPGEEVAARALHVAPGGHGMQAVACARLGLETALVAPLARTGVDGVVREALEAERVRVAGDDRVAGAGVTALLTTGDGVAMASALRRAEPSAAEVREVGAGAVLLSIGRLPLAPPEAAVYAVTGGLELASVSAASLARTPAVRAIVATAAEARSLTERSDAEGAARALAERAGTAVVTMGAEGAIAVEGGDVVRAAAPRVAVRDATGAGDLFAAAYAWADVRGAPLPSRLAWATLYASISVRAPTALEGALRLEALLEEGAARGLEPPPGLTLSPR